MQPTDRKRFVTCLVAAGDLYGKAPSQAVIALWWDALKGYDVEAIEAAFGRHLQSPDVGQFMPKPADVIRMLAGTSVDSAMVAWAKVDKAVRSVGPYASVTFDDPLIQRVIQDMGGWIDFGRKGEDEWPFIGNQFRTRYQGYRSKGEVPDYPPRLIGISEADNARRGLAAAESVLIGDASKAERVRAGGSDMPAIGFQRIGAGLRMIETKGNA